MSFQGFGGSTRGILRERRLLSRASGLADCSSSCCEHICNAGLLCAGCLQQANRTSSSCSTISLVAVTMSGLQAAEPSLMHDMRFWHSIWIWVQGPQE